MDEIRVGKKYVRQLNENKNRSNSKEQKENSKYGSGKKLPCAPIWGLSKSVKKNSDITLSFSKVNSESNKKFSKRINEDRQLSMSTLEFTNQAKLNTKLSSITNCIKTFLRIKPIISNCDSAFESKENSFNHYGTLSDYNSFMSLSTFGSEEANKNCVSDYIVNANEMILSFKSQEFNFNKIFTAQQQQTIWEESCKEAIDDFLADFKSGMIFAYGISNSGKTHSIIGRAENEGLLPLTLDYISEQQNKFKDYTLKCTYVEIYNEEVYDLLSDIIDSKVQLREKEKRFYLTNCTYSQLNSIEDYRNCLYKGLKRKKHLSTSININSSRSHTIFTIYLYSQGGFDVRSNDDFSSSLSVSDLAGNEKFSLSESVGKGHKEMCKINNSLLCLSRCFEALRFNLDPININATKKPVPFRESKLTLIFQDYLLGDANLILINHVSMLKIHEDDNLRILNYCKCARSIKLVKAKVNSNFKKPYGSSSKFQGKAVTESLENEDAKIQRLRAERIQCNLDTGVEEEIEKANLINTKLKHLEIANRRQSMIIENLEKQNKMLYSAQLKIQEELIVSEFVLKQQLIEAMRVNRNSVENRCNMLSHLPSTLNQLNDILKDRGSVITNSFSNNTIYFEQHKKEVVLTVNSVNSIQIMERQDKVGQLTLENSSSITILPEDKNKPILRDEVKEDEAPKEENKTKKYKSKRTKQKAKETKEATEEKSKVSEVCQVVAAYTKDDGVVINDEGSNLFSPRSSLSEYNGSNCQLAIEKPKQEVKGDYESCSDSIIEPKKKKKYNKKNKKQQEELVILSENEVDVKAEIESIVKDYSFDYIKNLKKKKKK